MCGSSEFGALKTSELKHTSETFLQIQLRLSLKIPHDRVMLFCLSCLTLTKIHFFVQYSLTSSIICYCICIEKTPMLFICKTIAADKICD